MRIAVDAMGGDHAPRAVVLGAARAAAEDGTSILLVGDEGAVRKALKRARPKPPAALIEVVHADQVVGMDEPAITPIRRKRRSSIRICCDLVRSGDAQAVVTAGNTGAAMISAKLVIGTVAGVDRPALAVAFPNQRGGRTVLLDVGANIDSKPAQLREFAVMGHFFAQELLGTPAPRIGLMSIGEEESKGSELTREVFKVMKTTGLNFVGNVEGRDVWSGIVDVVVCDGFVGNVLLKSAESLAHLIGAMLRQEIRRSWRNRLGYLIARPAFMDLQRRIDYQRYGAAPLLGVKGGCFIGHGRSQPRAVHASIRGAVEFCTANLHTRIRDKVAELHAQEARHLASPAENGATPS